MRENEQQVLEYINGLREQYGIGEPLSEMPPDLTIEQYHQDGDTVAIHCPVAVALDKTCGAYYVRLGTGDERIQFPDFVSSFIVDHDCRFVDRLKETYELS
jgi:hypothetical protein